MKKIFLIAIVTLLASCSSAEREYKTDSGIVPKFKVVENSFSNGQIYIVEIDSCEYIINKNASSGGVCHKGNCKNSIHWKTITR